MAAPQAVRACTSSRCRRSSSTTTSSTSSSAKRKKSIGSCSRSRTPSAGVATIWKRRSTSRQTSTSSTPRRGLRRGWTASRPTLADDGRVELRGARHPLLIPAVQELTARVLDARGGRHRRPISWSCRRRRALVISGPNTGGKTVALKAVRAARADGAGRDCSFRSSRGSRLTPFRSIFADIGDEQSIAASLSTFSAHIANIVAMERALELPALVLLDEVGSGTDPVEGGALGAAVIDHFRRRGALVVATTHDDALKSYAATTRGRRCRGVRLQSGDVRARRTGCIYGAPGRSLALEIAERLGMPAAVVADARARRSGASRCSRRTWRAWTRNWRPIEQRTRSTHGRRDRGRGEERHALLEREARLAEREAVLKKRLDDRLNEKLREARAEVDRVVGSLKRRPKRWRSGPNARGRAARRVCRPAKSATLRADARAALGAIGDAARRRRRPTTDAACSATPPDIGQTVFVHGVRRRRRRPRRRRQAGRGRNPRQADARQARRLAAIVGGQRCRRNRRSRAPSPANTVVDPSRDAGCGAASSCWSAPPSTMRSAARRSSSTMRCSPTSGGCASSTATAQDGCARRCARSSASTAGRRRRAGGRQRRRRWRDDRGAQRLIKFEVRSLKSDCFPTSDFQLLT